MLEFKLLLLLFAANSAPVLARNVLGERCNTAIDRGFKLRDGRFLFGPSKTWRGLVAALLSTSLAAVVLALPVALGVIIASFAMLGDLASSFVKRRLGKAPSDQAIFLDQIPESLLPLFAGRWLFDYSWATVVIVTLLFMLIALSVSPLLFKLGIRKRPY
ncbi:MAG: CDP-archaeol synthase [Pseudomonadales bacterium]